MDVLTDTREELTKGANVEVHVHVGNNLGHEITVQRVRGVLEICELHPGDLVADSGGEHDGHFVLLDVDDLVLEHSVGQVVSDSLVNGVLQVSVESAFDDIVAVSEGDGIKVRHHVLFI